MTNTTSSYDVARLAGVTRSTVSMVLHGKADQHRISRKTQERVLDAIKKLGYVPNMIIRDIFRGNGDLAGVSGQHDDIPAVAKAAFAAAGIKLDIEPLSGDMDAATKQFRKYVERGIPVLFMPPSHHPSADKKPKAPKPAKPEKADKPDKIKPTKPKKSK